MAQLTILYSSAYLKRGSFIKLRNSHVVNFIFRLYADLSIKGKGDPVTAHVSNHSHTLNQPHSYGLKHPVSIQLLQYFLCIDLLVHTFTCLCVNEYHWAPCESLFGAPFTSNPCNRDKNTLRKCCYGNCN